MKEAKDQRRLSIEVKERGTRTIQYPLLLRGEKEIVRTPVSRGEASLYAVDTSHRWES